jgi:hypothetical protein
MRWITWFQKQISLGTASHGEARRVRLAGTQRQLSQRVERVLHQTERHLLSIAERIRRSDGSRAEEHELELEQQSLERWLDRCEIMQTTTSELLREWRDWSRALRQGIATDLERAELIRSELRVRGVLLEEDMGGGSLANQVVGQEVRQGEAEPDLFEEWDQYLGETLPLTARFWQARVQTAQEKGASERALHIEVKRMREAHGHANVWKKMQQGLG